MKIAFVIAARNLLRHKGKSLVIGAILFVGALIMTLGNAVISGMNRGLSENIVERFTGHIVIVSDKQENPNVILNFGKEILLIREYKKTRAVLLQASYIRDFLPAARGFSFILNEEGDFDFAPLIGVNFPEYNRIFKENVKQLEGRLLESSERGILMSDGRRKRLFNDSNIWIKPVGYPLDEKNLSEEAKKFRGRMLVRDNLVLMGQSGDSTASDVRVEVKGIIRYEFFDDLWKMFTIIDIETFRECFQWVTNTDAATSLDKDTKALISREENLDDLFKQPTIVNTKSSRSEMAKTIRRLKDKPSIAQAKTDAGAYNVIFIKLKEKENLDSRLNDLNKALKDAGAQSRAVSWQQAMGQLGEMAAIIRGALIGFVFFIFFVAIIIIMNTLSMAALERTAELGMMRAVGAQKRFVTVMFFIETACLALLFGGLGILMGAAAVPILKAFKITAENNILQLLFGGKTFAPYLGFADIIIGVVELALVTVIAALYPIRVARRITPLDAISRD